MMYQPRNNGTLRRGFSASAVAMMVLVTTVPAAGADEPLIDQEYWENSIEPPEDWFNPTYCDAEALCYAYIEFTPTQDNLRAVDLMIGVGSSCRDHAGGGGSVSIYASATTPPIGSTPLATASWFSAWHPCRFDEFDDDSSSFPISALFSDLATEPGMPHVIEVTLPQRGWINVDPAGPTSFFHPGAGAPLMQLDGGPQFRTYYEPTTDADADDDGVVDADDVCPDTDLDESPPPTWKKNRFWANASGEFVDAQGSSSGYDMVDTAGCSASQIIEAQGLGSGHRRHGLSRSALDAWVAQQRTG